MKYYHQDIRIVNSLSVLALVYIIAITIAMHTIHIKTCPEYSNSYHGAIKEGMLVVRTTSRDIFGKPHYRGFHFRLNIQFLCNDINLLFKRVYIIMLTSKGFKQN